MVALMTLHINDPGLLCDILHKLDLLWLSLPYEFFNSKRDYTFDKQENYKKRSDQEGNLYATCWDHANNKCRLCGTREQFEHCRNTTEMSQCPCHCIVGSFEEIRLI